MDGITSFVDRLQTQQPLRNAVRGLLGMPRRRSNVIDPMEEMTARDREMGGDISNPFPQQNRFPGRQVQATQELPAPARTAQPAIETIPTPPPVDESQPYKGQSIFQAMFRTPQDGIDAQRKAAGGATMTQAPAGGGSALSARIAAINADASMEPADKLDAHANLMAEAAAQAAFSGNREAQQTLVRVSEAYAQRAAAMRNQKAQQGIADQVRTYHQNVLEQNSPEKAAKLWLDAAKQAAEHDVQLTEAALGRQRAAERADGSTAAQFANFASPLVENPAMSVEEYAAGMANAVRAQAPAGQPVDPAAIKAAYDNAYQTGTRVRVQQYITDMMNDAGPEFDDTHPGFMELQSHFTRMLAENPDSYDQLSDFLVAAVAPAVRTAMRDLPPEDQVAYIKAIIEGNESGRGLLGPKVEPTSLFGF